MKRTGLTLSLRGESRDLELDVVVDRKDKEGDAERSAAKGAGEGDAPEEETQLADGELKGGRKHKLATLLELEELEAKPRDLLTYFVWAEDVGPDGTTRRAMSDLFFAEVRHFEDIFRETEPPPGGMPGEGGGPTDELVKLQKQVLNADWKLTRDVMGGRKMADILPDVEVVKDSQQITIVKLDGVLEQVSDAEIRAFLVEARGHMDESVKVLEKGISDVDEKSLEAAMTPQRQAYESLLRAQSREHNITRAQDSQSSGQGQQQEQQLMQLEMKQDEQRYEEQSEAQDQQAQGGAEQEENLVVLNRLKELAKRQEALAQKIKELEAQLDEAETEEEKEELRKQLKRLQEEQEQLLRELDSVMEKMDEEDNRANMAEEREKLEKTRENVREAAEKLKDEDKLAEAANAATRAERELDEVKEDFREKTARKFAEEMKAVRDQARSLASRQEEIAEKIEAAAGERKNSQNPFDQSAQRELNTALQEQGEQLAEILETMKQISEDAEDGEPLLSNALYEAVREAQTGGVEKSLAETGDWARFGRMDEARESQADAARGIEELKNDVEKAAERVLGSESEALRMARSELENLIEQAQREADEADEAERGWSWR